MDAQPDFEALAGHFQGVGNQINRLRNLPAVNDGAQLVMHLQQLQQQQREQYQQLMEQMGQTQQNIARLEAALDKMASKADIAESNALIRFENSSTTRGDTQLVLPISFETGTTITGCPDTASEILRLTSTQVNEALTQVHLPTTGRLADRTRRLLKYMGVTTQAI